MDDVITYEILYELLRKEKYSAELMETDKEFYIKAVRYLQEKQKLVDAQKGKDSIFAAEVIKTQRQLDNAGKIIQDFYEKREGKILQLAIGTSRIKRKDPPANMLPEEKKMFFELFDVLKRYRSGILDNMLTGKKPHVEDIAPKDIKGDIREGTHKIIRFTNPVPQFVAEDLKTYGPFEKEDVATIPPRAAGVIINKKRGEEIVNEAQQEST